MTRPDLFTLQSLKDYCEAKLAEHPEWADDPVEMRYCLLAAPPSHVEHDEETRTWVLVGVN